MARPKLTNVEKQWRKKKRAEERARAKAAKDIYSAQLKLRAKREKAFRKLMGNRFRFLYCLDNTATVRMAETTDTIGYDQLAELVMLFNSTNLNIGVTMEGNYDTFGGTDTGYLDITIENVDWTKLDK